MSDSLPRMALGRRVKELRIARGFGLRRFAALSGISPAFLSEIEAGRKEPSLDTIRAMALVLECSPGALISPDNGSTSSHGADSAAAVEKIPFDAIGVSVGGLAVRAGQNPTRPGDVGAEHLLRVAVRCEIEKNLVDEHIETRAREYREKLLGESAATWSDQLQTWLREQRGIAVRRFDLADFPSLGRDRVIAVGSPVRLLLLHPKLSPQRVLFVLAREVGYADLGIGERSRVYPPDQERSYDQVLNDYRASYFAAALLVPGPPLLDQIRPILAAEEWRSSAFEEILKHYENVATPETVMYRFGQITTLLATRPRRTHFLKIVSNAAGDFTLEKRLNLTSDYVPTSNAEHLCRRWLATRTIRELREGTGSRVVDAQISRFPNSDEAYFGISVALRADPLSSIRAREDGIISLTVGFRITPGLQRSVGLLNDANLRRREVGGYCERCALACDDRAEKPLVLQRHNELQSLLALD